MTTLVVAADAETDISDILACLAQTAGPFVARRTMTSGSKGQPDERFSGGRFAAPMSRPNARITA
jgi:hypothetical protein